MMPYFGETVAIITSLCWALTSVAFEKASKKIGSLSLNLIRLWMAFVFLSIFSYFTRGLAFPVDASNDTYFWLIISGLVGFVFGDLFLFEAYRYLTARITMLIFSSVPPLSALLAFWLYGDLMHGLQILGMGVTVSGIAIVILTRDPMPKTRKVVLAHPFKGVLFAFLGALGQSFGYIISKMGLNDYDPFAATHIRVMAAIVGFTLIITLRKGWPTLMNGLKNKSAMISTTIGSIFGPFIGVSLSLLALQHTTPGVAATLTSLAPILLIPIGMIYLKEKIHYKEIIGALVAVLGVALMFLS